MSRSLLPSWRVLLALSVVVVVAGDATLIGLGTGYLGSGFNSQHVDGASGVVAYLAASALFDLALVLGLWGVGRIVLRVLRTPPLQTYCALAMLGVGIPLSVAIGLYDLHVMLGRFVSLSLLRTGSASSSMQMAAVALNDLPPVGAIAIGAGLLLALVILVLARFAEARFPALAPRTAAPDARRLCLAFVGTTLLSAGVLVFAHGHAQALRYGLDHKASGFLLESAIRLATDFDHDGFGLLDQPPDPAPFDASIRPDAPEVPGNGIDENGLGGDLPLDFAAQQPIAPLGRPARARPQFLLIYLESFRADLLDRKLHGREITPFMNRLAREGTRSEEAWVHSPWTLPSRAQLFSGSIVPHPGAPTLVDDFHRRGYRVALFSGQDDSYGNSMELMGSPRADHVYTARQDLDRRTSRTTTPVSLQVSWKTLVSRVDAYLDQVDPHQPLFLYVNIVDTHFPYYHHELDPILDVAPIARSDIRKDQAQRVFEAYENAAANVDRAAEHVVRKWQERMRGQPQAILLTGDHGQAFYEHGLLGHGQDLRQDQSRVPFVLHGIGGEWTEPIAPSDIRGLLDRNLFLPRTGEPRAHFTPDPQREVFQYLGKLEEPQRLGLRSLGGLLEYDVVHDRAWRLGPDDQPEPGAVPAAVTTRLIHVWESHVLGR